MASAGASGSLLTKSSKNKNLTKKATKQLDTLILKDGSLNDRTTRGNRALWYYYETPSVAFITMEIAHYFEVKTPKSSVWAAFMIEQ